MTMQRQVMSQTVTHLVHQSTAKPGRKEPITLNYRTVSF